MERGSIFAINQTQAILLPASMRLPYGTRSVDIVRRGRAWIMVPSQDSWAQWFEEAGISDDFMPSRDQPDSDNREAL